MGKWFRTRIREARERAGLSQSELGEKFSTTQTTIWNWENGVSEPRDEQYKRVTAWMEGVEEKPGAPPRPTAIEDEHGDIDQQSELHKGTGLAQSGASAAKGSPASQAARRGTLRDQLGRILPKILPAKPEEAILGSELLERVKAKLDDDYADGSIRQHFSVMSADPASPIARVEDGYGYYLRPPAPTVGSSTIERPQTAIDIEPNPSEPEGREQQLEEKFRAVFVRYEALSNRFPMIVEHTRGKRAQSGINRWKFPDVIVLEWEVGEVKDTGFRLDRVLLEVKRSLGEQPFRLSSVELKVALTLSAFRAAFFQCVSNSKWAHHAILAVATRVSDKTLAEELRRLGSSYDVSVVSFGLRDEELDRLPSATSILRMTESEFEKTIASRVQYHSVATGKPRDSLDWEHVRDMRAQSPEFGHLFEWISHCLAERTPYTFDDYQRVRATQGKYA